MLTLPGIRTIHNSAWAETNMVESLFCAADEFGTDLLVCYSDIVYTPTVLETLLASDHAVSVIVDQDWRRLWEQRFDNPLSDAESLRIDIDGCITDIGQKVDNIDDIEAQYIGLMRFKGNGIDVLRAARESWGSTSRPWMTKRPVNKAYMTDLLSEMILLGNQVHAVPVHAGWFEVDDAEDIAVAELELTRQSFL